MEEQVLETGGEAEREEHRDSSVDIEKKPTNYSAAMLDLDKEAFFKAKRLITKPRLDLDLFTPTKN